LHELIEKRSETLFEIQKGEAEEKQVNRDVFMNTVLLSLTGFTLVSVLADTWSLLEGKETFPDIALHKVDSFVEFVITLFLLMILIVFNFRRRK
jgi:hypothetical protein